MTILRKKKPSNEERVVVILEPDLVARVRVEAKREATLPNNR